MCILFFLVLLRIETHFVQWCIATKGCVLRGQTKLYVNVASEAWIFQKEKSEVSHSFCIKKGTYCHLFYSNL